MKYHPRGGGERRKKGGRSMDEIRRKSAYKARGEIY
jgi:hypothetical protein